MSTAPPADAADFGIGLRYSLHPACDDFVEVIMSALDGVAGAARGLEVDTGTVSTYVGAIASDAEPALALYLRDVIVAATKAIDGGHLVAHALLSRGCPGEMQCGLLDRNSPPVPKPVGLPAAGIDCEIQWSLYPLMDGNSGHGEHLAPIERAIEVAQQSGLTVTPAHFATVLRGDLALALELVFNTWAEVGRTVPHVVSHITISIGSPSLKETA
jgi:energy-coupling factor transport system substrate-specific component